jgi:hypothetical protein
MAVVSTSQSLLSDPGQEPGLVIVEVGLGVDDVARRNQT